MISLDNLFESYEDAQDRFQKKINELNSLNTFVLTKIGPAYSPDAEIFNIRGSRFFLIVKKVFWPSGIGEFVDIKLIWKLKQKNKKKFLDTSLEEVLDSNLISNKAKEEIVFNLRTFLNNK
jgi:hypothetical protein